MPWLVGIIPGTYYIKKGNICTIQLLQFLGKYINLKTDLVNCYLTKTYLTYPYLANLASLTLTLPGTPLS